MVNFIDGDVDVSSISSNVVFYISAFGARGDFPTMNLSEASTSKINHEVWNEVIDYYNRNVDSFEQFEREVGVNLWFFLNFRLYFELRNYRIRIATIEAFWEKFPKGVVLSSDKTLLELFPTSNIKLLPSLKRGKKKPNLKRLLAEIIQIIRTKDAIRSEVSETVIISNLADHIDGKNKRFHTLQSLYSLLPVKDLFDISKPIKPTDLLFDTNYNSNWVVKRYLFSYRNITDQLRITKSMNSLFQSIGSTTDSDKEIYKLIKGHQNSYRVYLILYKAFLKFFKSSGIKNILLSGENNTQSRSIVQAASHAGLKTFGFQHGAIHDLHPSYIFGKYDGVVPLPNKTFVWGSRFEKMLISKGGYRKDQVVSAGRLSLYTKRILNPDIDRNKKIILYATQPQRNPNLRKQQLLDVLTVAQALKSTHQLVLRPHPRETDDGYFQTIGVEVGFSDFLIDRTSDLFSHFECCDYLIMSFSTVGLEFIPYYKPLLVLDYLKEDLIGYISEGVGIPIYNRSDLSDILSATDLKIERAIFDDYLMRNYRSSDDAEVVVKKEIANATSKTDKD